MVIDCHTSLWPSSLDLGQAASVFSPGGHDIQQNLPQEHLESSRPAQATIVLGFVSDMLKVEIPNDFVMDHVSTQPTRMTAFAGIDPTRPQTAAKVKVLAERGFAGLTISPASQGFHPADSRVMGIYELAQELALPIYFLQGHSMPTQANMEFAQPVLIDEIAREFPELKIIISHMGHPWIEQTLTLIAKNTHIFADIVGLVDRPWHAYRVLSLAHEFSVTDKLIFGSGFPVSSVKASVEALYNTNKIALEASLPAVPRERIRGIIERDSLKLLGISLAG